VDVTRLFEYRYWSAFLEWEIWVFLLTGLQNTLTIAVVAIVLSLLLGTLLALARLAPWAALRVPAALYVEVVRALPVIFLIFFTFFAGARYGLTNPIAAAIVALTLYTSAVNAEIIRAGILSVERGQLEAARSLGLGYVDMMRLIVLPQALRRMVPPQVSQLITLIKDTSLAYVIGTQELLNKVKILYAGFEVGVLQGLFVAAVIYFVINYALSLLSRRLEIRPEDRIAAEAGTVAARPVLVRPA
jgi:aspartate/glutamate/glutamine transport system permease protein